MKNLLSIIIISTLFLGGAYGQDIDKSKMQRDIEVAENILATLINQGDNNEMAMAYLGRSPFKGNYISGYGVIFGAPRGLPNVLYVGSKGLGSYSYSISDSENGTVIVSPSKDKNEELLDEDSLNNIANQKWIENARTFLVDYAHLIGQLKPEDKIVVSNGPSAFGDRQFFTRTKVSRTSVEVLKKDLDAFHSGKIARDQLMKLIKVTSNEEGKVEKDVELMANIFKTLYKQDLSDTYYVSGGVYAQKMSGLGVIMQMNVYSSISERDGLHRIITQDLGGLTREERDEKVKAMYPEFLEDLKRNIVQYGRTLKSIKADEQLIFNIQLTQCKGCEIPKSLEVSIKGADLSAFNSGSISESTAISRITVKEIGKQ